MIEYTVDAVGVDCRVGDISAIEGSKSMLIRNTKVNM